MRMQVEPKKTSCWPYVDKYAIIELLIDISLLHLLRYIVQTITISEQ